MSVFLELTCDVRSPIPTHDRMAMGGMGLDSIYKQEASSETVPLS